MIIRISKIFYDIVYNEQMKFNFEVYLTIDASMTLEKDEFRDNIILSKIIICIFMLIFVMSVKIIKYIFLKKIFN